MGEITFYTREQVRDLVTGRSQNVEPITRNAALAIRELGSLHHWGLEKVAATLTEAQRMMETVGELSASQQAQVTQRTRRFIGTVLQIQDETARNIVSHLQQR